MTENYDATNFTGIWQQSFDSQGWWEQKDSMRRRAWQAFQEFIKDYPLKTFSVTEEWLRVNHGAGERVTLRLEMAVYYL